MTNDQRLSTRSELRQKPHVVRVKVSDVFDAPAQQRDPLDTNTERETRHPRAVVARCLDYLRVHHSGAEDLDPARSMARVTLTAVAATYETVHRHFHAWFDERKVAVMEDYLSVRTEHRARPLVEHTLQVGHPHTFIDRKTLDLRQHPLVRRVRRLLPVKIGRASCRERV